jgi:hypothetical protein
VKLAKEVNLLTASDILAKDRERAGSAEMPRLAAFAGQIVEARKAGEILELRAFRPHDILSDRLVERALRTAADYLASYVVALAKADPERARVLAEGIEVPWVRPLELSNGRSKAVVEVVRLSDYLTQNALIIGELAARTSVRRLVKKKPEQSRASEPDFAVGAR